jgi:hypothetical protein
MPTDRSTAMQTVMHRSPRGAVVVMDSAADITADNRGRDVVVNASYAGVLPARLLADHLPRAAIGIDCGVGPEGVGIAGLWYFEALNIPAAAADVMTVTLGDGVDLYKNGVVRFLNRPAQDCGVQVGMTVSQAAMLMLDHDPGRPGGYQVTNRTLVYRGRDGRQAIVMDSIVFGTEADRRNVIISAGHTGRSGARHILAVRPFGVICSDGGQGRARSGVAGLPIINGEGIAGAAVDARRARLGDGMSTYRDGIITDVNDLAARAGVTIGMPAADAACLLVDRAE